jgi:hypothetical protein
MTKHLAAFEYDWRTRFAVPLASVGRRAMSWGEAYRLTTVLASDPGSQVYAALAGWPHPVTREWIVAADHRDSTEYGRAGRRARPYPRPWTAKQTKRIGTGRYSPAELRRLLDARRRQEGPTGDG